ncbi:MAG: cupin domain-containing protein [Gaiellaceae bacterium]
MNVFGDAWEGGSDRPGFTWRTMRVGGELLGASVYELPPGEKSFPYHFHNANEELLVVLDGEPTLRDRDSERRLSVGDAVVFPRGPSGGHQLRNDSDRPARVLMVSTLVVPEVVDYPDSGKAGVAGGTVERAIFRRSDAVDYWEGEE